MPDSDLNILAVDTTIGGDASAPGIAQPVSLAEVEEIIHSNRPVDARREQLLEYKQELTARHSADTEAGFKPLLDEIDRGLALLTQDAAGNATPSVLDPIDEDASKGKM